jgi:Kef-type K+ transport system membrane component KefB/nucleotide-binding universal stress UspA family protein
VGWLFRRIHQPQVVGEMVAGLLLGPTLLGAVAPSLSAALFPPESLTYLATLSQLGLWVFMFLIGLELDPALLRGRGRTAVVTSNISIALPFALGALLGPYLHSRLSEPGVAFTGFVLFMGAAMSITAFPVLARILTERNLLQTRVGALSIACAAVGDVSAWIILAIVIAVVRHEGFDSGLGVTLLGTLLYVTLIVVVVRRVLRWLLAYYRNRGRLTQDMLAIVLLLVLASAWFTERIGIHALFGAFALGAVMPKDRDLIHDITGKLEDFTVVFLLPLFFAITGLRTHTGGFALEMLPPFLLIMLAAVVGKFGGSTVAARATGIPWRESAAIGVLLNTRGLMELVILNIGLDLGVISPTLFTLMVFMAIITTFMTTPVLDLLYPLRYRIEIGETEPTEDYTILIPVALPSAGPRLLEVATTLIPAGRTPRLYALHLSSAADQSLTELTPPRPASEDDALRPALEAATDRGLMIRPLAFVSRDPAQDIVDVASLKRADLILLGSHRPIIAGGILDGTVGFVLEHARADVAVFVQRGFPPWRRVFVASADSAFDGGALDVAHRIAAHSGLKPTVLRTDKTSAPVETAQADDLIIVALPPHMTSLDEPYERLARHASLLVVRNWSKQRA